MQTVDLLIPIVLALTMFGVGTSLDVADFKAIFAQPRTIALGLVLQMAFLPAVALGAALSLPISPAWKMGLFILALCPGGATSNFISYLLDLKTALSIALTSINSLLILITIPLGVELGSRLFLEGGTAVSLSVGDTLANVLMMVLLPVGAGLSVNHFFKRMTTQLRQPIKVISTLLLAAVFGIKFFGGQQSGGSGIQWADIQVLGPVMLAFHGLTMGGSYWLAGRLRTAPLNAVTIAIEVGLQNTTLALLVTTVMLGSNEMGEPTLVYAIFSFFTTLLFGYLAKRSAVRSSQKPR